MKRIVPLLTAMFIIAQAHAQFTFKIKADSVLVTNDSCTAELIIENSTKSVKGFLYNRGNGRTEFRAGLVKIDDTTYLVGEDTLKLHKLPVTPWLQGGNSFGTTGTFGTIDSNAIRFITDNTEKSRLLPNGNWLVNTTADSGYKLYVNGKLRAGDSALIGAANTGSISGLTSYALKLYGNLEVVTAVQGGVNGGLKVGYDSWARPGATHLLLNNTGVYSYDNKWYFGGPDTTFFGVKMTGTGLTGGPFTRTKYTLSYDSEPAGSNNSYAIFGVSNKSEFDTAAAYPSGSNFYMLETRINGPIVATNTGDTAVRAPLRISARQLLMHTGDASPGTEAMRIVENGNVLIGGSTDNGYKLDVEGTARIATLPYLAARDTVLTYDPSTNQLKATKITGNRVSSLSFHSDATADITLTDQPNTEQYLANNTRNRRYFDASAYDSVRLVANIITESASSNTPRLYIQYSTDGSSWTTIGSGSGTDVASLSDDVLVKTVWIVLPGGAKGDVIFRVAQNGGDTSADPAIGKVEMQFK